MQSTGDSGPTVSVIAEHPPVELVDRRDDHTRVWEIAREVETTHPDGNTTADIVKSYIFEKGSGLCYRDATGNFVPSVAEWRETPEGFVIDRCAYGLSVGKTLGSWMSFSIDGRRVFLRPCCLMASDGKADATLAAVNLQAQGLIQVDCPSILRFPDAFGKGLDLEFVAEKDGYHQNLILANAPGLPRELDEQRACLYLYTEIDLGEFAADASCGVRIGRTPIDIRRDDFITEPCEYENIFFTRAQSGPQGDARHRPMWWLAQSKVFDSSGRNETRAARQLLKEGPQAPTYLVESVPYSFLADAVFPVVLDYEPKSGAIRSDETWGEADDTYYVSGDVTVGDPEPPADLATLTILPGTTVKINYLKSISIIEDGRIVAQGQPTDYIVFTKATDPDYGEPIDDQKDPALPGPFLSAIDMEGDSSSDSIIQYCKMLHGIVPIYCGESLNNPIANNIIQHVGLIGINVQWSDVVNVSCRNNLVTGDDYWYGIYYYEEAAEEITNNTVHDASCGIELIRATCPRVTDNLLTNCGTGIGAHEGDLHLDYNGYFNSTYYNVSGRDMGPNSIELGSSPYAQEGEFFLGQSCLLIDAGSSWTPEPLDGPHAYSTCDYAKRDVGRTDIGFHFTCYEDTDGDGMPNVWEDQWDLDPEDPDDADDDDDGEGLKNLHEFWHGSDPTDSDTDDDLYNDHSEVGIQEKKLLRGWGPAVYDFNAGPWLTNATDDEITIGWWVGSAGSPRLYYKKETDSNFTQVDPKSIRTRNGDIEGKVYEKRLTELTSDTAYQYYVKCTISEIARSSPVCKFRTLEDSPSSFRFIVYGDNRGQNNNDFNENAAHVVRAILSKAPDAKFVIDVGDFLYIGGTAEQWRQHFFLPTTRLIAEYALFPAVGNHEYDGDDNLDYYLSLFDYPDEPDDPQPPVYYGFGYGGWYFICLDTNEASTFNEAGDPQREWLSGVLGDEEKASGKPIVVWFHQPPFSTSRRGGDEPVRYHLVPIFEDEDNDVRVVFNGHDHFYECLEEEGITYVITGGAGAPLNKDPWYYQNEPNGATCLAREAWFHYCIVEISPGGIGFTAIHDSGVPMDILGEAERVETFGLGDGEEWYYNDSGQNLGTEWKERDYSHSWSSADAPLGFGEGQTPQLQDDYVTYYFRKEGVDINGFAQAEQIAIKVHCDDGCVVYVNGVEAFRHNMPVGPIDYLTEAPYTIGTEDWQEYLRTVNRYIVPRELFAAEDNVIAIEVHQCLPTSSDLNIDVGVWTWY